MAWLVVFGGHRGFLYDALWHRQASPLFTFLILYVKCCLVFCAGMSAVLPHLVAKVDADFRSGDLKSSQDAQDTLNKWCATSFKLQNVTVLVFPSVMTRSIHNSNCCKQLAQCSK